MRGKYLSAYGDFAESIYAQMETLSNQGYLRYENRLGMRGKYLKVFGECAERIYASMEKTQKDSWRFLQIRQEM
jgi:hypothetical protein